MGAFFVLNRPEKRKDQGENILASF
jgi:hypothetical protein